MYEYVLPGVPLSWKPPYVGCKGAWSTRTPIINQLKEYLWENYGIHKNPCPYTIEALALDFIFYMSIPRSASKKKRMLMLEGIIRPDKRPDRTNLIKHAEDILKGVVFSDDCLVVDGRASQYYDTEPRTVIRIYLIDEYEKKFGRLE